MQTQLIPTIVGAVPTRTTRTPVLCMAAITAAVLLAGCGQKGPLTLPPQMSKPPASAPAPVSAPAPTKVPPASAPAPKQ